uniref:Peptidase S8/S53 domain-containing protein n=1 Tax=Ananas comosus var. bracteatus TaxID=296719 RepID=A0A6V7QNP1_ANACO|nr:unnamed protein product [Ananas comosus var. bracteatus]
MDAAVADGADVLSLSIGGPSVPFYDDSIALGAFGAIEKGVFVSCAAGNGGPDPSSLSNEAPWILTVGRARWTGAGKPSAEFCYNGSLDGFDVRGKIVLCEVGDGVARIVKGAVVQSAGGVGMVLMNAPPYGYTTSPTPTSFRHRTSVMPTD